jgi:hypothetical protein
LRLGKTLSLPYSAAVARKHERNIGAEILEGIREIKRGEVGRVVSFPDLLESVREGGAILRGEREPARAFFFDEPDVLSLRDPPEANGTPKKPAPPQSS